MLAAVVTAAHAPAAVVPLRTVDTPHYLIHTDVPAADAPLVDDLAKRMEAMYDEYDRQLADFHPAAGAARFQVYLFAHRDRFAAFTRVAGPNSGGAFVNGPHPFLATSVDGQDRDELRQTLQHEGFHQFAYFAVSRRLPVWLNEGLAELFEEGVWAGDRFLLGQVTPRRVRQLHSDLDRNAAVPVRSLLATTPAVWAGTLRRDVNAGESNYAAAWAVAQYLTFGPDPDARRRRDDLLRTLHDLDRAGDASDAATAAAVHDCFPDVAQFQSALTAWCRDLQPTDDARLLERQKVLADFLVDFRNAGRTFPDVAAFRGETLRRHPRTVYVRGRVRFQTDADPSVYFADMAGVPYPPQDLSFDPAAAAPLPDLVCRAAPGFTVRTRFYRDGAGTLGHEVSVTTAAGR